MCVSGSKCLLLSWSILCSAFLFSIHSHFLHRHQTCLLIFLIYISRLTAKCLVLSVYLWPRQGVIIHQTGFVFREYMYLSCSNVKMNIVNNLTDNSSILLKWNNNLYFGNFGSSNIRVERFVYHRVKKIRISLLQIEQYSLTLLYCDIKLLWMYRE